MIHTIRSLIVFTVIVIFLFFSSNVYSQTYVNGVIINDTIWTLDNSPYIVNGGIIVSEGITLNIEPGVVIKFDSGISLAVRGTLVARGTASQPIVFTKNTADNWGFILFEEKSVDAVFDPSFEYVSGSVLEHCIVEYAGNADVQYSGAVRINKTHPFINHCVIRNNSATGIQVWGISEQLRITHSTIHDCIPNATCSPSSGNPCGGGISAYLSPSNKTNQLFVFRNNIYDNIARSSGFSGGGGVTTYNVNSDILSNRIVNNHSLRMGGGINIYFASSIIRDNLIQYNKSNGGDGGGIYLRNSNSFLSNNIIINNIAEGQSSSSGGGMYIGASSRIEMSSNLIINNKATFEGGGMYVRQIYSSAMTRNSILTNVASNASAIAFYPTYSSSYKDYYFYNNIVKDNISEPYSISDTCAIYVKGFPNITENNLYPNLATYELCNDNNQTAGDVNAIHNWWNAQHQNEIEAKIYDFLDNSNLSFVNYMPWAIKAVKNAPIAGPSDLSAKLIQNETICKVSMKWSANPESNIAGYKVYWDSRPGYPYQNSANVGMQTQITRRGFKPGTHYFAVTAYNDYYSHSNSQSDYLINPEQGAGNESWFSNEIVVVIPDECFSANNITPMLFLLLEDEEIIH